jgi:integrase/recombinase XerD
MDKEVIPHSSSHVEHLAGAFPAAVTQAGERATRRFVEFFAANISNPNTRAAYARAIGKFFHWCDERNLRLEQITTLHVAAYVEQLKGERSRSTVKQNLAALRMLFDYLATGGVLPMNPAAAVRGPKHILKKGKTPVLTSDEARQLLDSIDCRKLSGLRDRALIGVMVFSFARVSATLSMTVADYFPQGRRMWFRLHEKGGKLHDVPAHHNAEAYVDAYLDAAGIWDQKRSPLFRTIDRHGRLTDRPLLRTNVLDMVKRRASHAGLPTAISCHTFRATGITAYLENGGSLEHAQAIAAHESARTTKLYDRTADTISLDEIERIVI